MIAIVHSIYLQSVHAPARDAGLMDSVRLLNMTVNMLKVLSVKLRYIYLIFQ